MAQIPETIYFFKDEEQDEPNIEVLKLDKHEQDHKDDKYRIVLNGEFVKWHTYEEFEKYLNWITEQFAYLKSKYH